MPRQEPLAPVPEETARVARAAFPKGTRCMQLRDELGPLYEDGDFAALYPTHGQPALAPCRLALVTVLQFAEGLSDRQATEAVRARIDWKYLLGLALEDPGFDYSALSEFRARLVDGAMEATPLERLLDRCRALDLPKARGHRHTDSTDVLTAVRELNPLELVGEALRQALNRLAIAAPDWLRARIPAAWYERHALRLENQRLPREQAARDALAAQIGADGLELHRAVYDGGAPGWLREVPAVETLRRVWRQQYTVIEGGVRWRTSGEQPPAA